MKTMLVMAGGTGGHVFPALAVAEFLRDKGVRVVWLGTRLGLEARVIPPTGIEVRWLTISGLRGKGVGRALIMPFLLLRSLMQGIKIMLDIKPDALLGMGGFAAGPGAVSGWLLRKPLVIHEANASAGLTNRMLAPIARRILVGFPNTDGLEKKVEWTGNPLRSQIVNSKDRSAQCKKRILIVGGSLGARVFNQKLPKLFQGWISEQGWEIWHQCGKSNRDEVQDTYAREGIKVRVDEFITDMGDAYTWATLVLCRAGAMTVAEVCMARLPAIYVPYPYAAGDHQTFNARYATDQGAARLLPEAELNKVNLQNLFAEFDTDELRRMSDAAESLARPNATEVVGSICMEVMNA